MPQLASMHQSGRCNYTYPNPWSQLYSYCYQVELCLWDSQPCCCGGSIGSSRRGHQYVFLSTTLLHLCYLILEHNLPLALLKCQMIVSSLGGDMPVRQLCPKVNLKIRRVNFIANLIVLESNGIDVILGMD
jgi:hypothetical protein